MLPVVQCVKTVELLLFYPVFWFLLFHHFRNRTILGHLKAAVVVLAGFLLIRIICGHLKECSPVFC